MVQGPLQTYVVNSSATGRSFFVDEATGSDDGNGSALQPFATLGAAHAACTANNNDTVYLNGTAHLTAKLTWSKNGTNLVGLRAPAMNPRSRLSSSGSVFPLMVDVTAQGCSFVNLGTFYGFADASAQVCWKDHGRNFYSGVLFGGGGNATAAAQAGMRSLVCDGDGESLFEGCVFGLDTVARATNANATLEFTGGSARNIFRRSIFQMLSSLAGNVHVKALTAGMDRWQYFQACAFINAIDSTATTITNDFSIAADAGGMCLLDPGCVSIGATNVSAAGPVYVGGPVPTGNTSSIAVAAS